MKAPTHTLSAFACSVRGGKNECVSDTQNLNGSLFGIQVQIGQDIYILVNFSDKPSRISGPVAELMSCKLYKWGGGENPEIRLASAGGISLKQQDAASAFVRFLLPNCRSKNVARVCNKSLSSSAVAKVHQKLEGARFDLKLAVLALAMTTSSGLLWFANKGSFKKSI